MADIPLRVIVTQSGTGNITKISTELDRAAASTNKFAKGARTAQVSIGKLNGVLLGMTTALGSRIMSMAVDGFTALAAAGPRFDAAMTQSLSIMGEVSTALREDMATAALDVAQQWNIGTKQAADSFFFLASAGLDAEASLQALPQVAAFAKAGMFDMALATDLLTDAQSALGLTIRDVETGAIDVTATMANMARVSDVLVKANTLANATVQQFSEALTTKSGAALRTFGKSVEEGVAVLAALADQGIKSEKAGTNLSIVLRNLTTAAVTNGKAFDKFGVEVFDSGGKLNNMADIIGDLEVALSGMSDEQKKATLLQLGFADRAQATIMALLGTSDAIRRYEAELSKAGGTTREVAEKQMQTLSQQVGLVGKDFERFGVEVFAEMGDSLTVLVGILRQGLLPVLFQVVKWAVQLTGIIGGGWLRLWELLAVSIAGGTREMETFAKATDKAGIIVDSLKLVFLSLGNIVLNIVKAFLQGWQLIADAHDAMIKKLLDNPLAKKGLAALGIDPAELQSLDMSKTLGLDAAIGKVDQWRASLGDAAAGVLDNTEETVAWNAAMAEAEGSLDGLGSGLDDLGGKLTATQKKLAEMGAELLKAKVELVESGSQASAGVGFQLFEPGPMEKARATLSLTLADFERFAERARQTGRPVEDIVEHLRSMGASDFILERLGFRLEEAEGEAFDFSRALQDAANVMQVLGIEADSFLGKLIGGGAGLAGAVSGFTTALATGGVGGIISAGSTLLGAGASFIGGLFGGNAAKDAAKDVGRQLGVTISEELGEELADQMERSGLGSFEVGLLNLTAIAEDAGVPITDLASGISDLLNATANGTVPAAEGIAELGSVFEQLVEQTGAGSAATVAFIQRARQLGLEIPAVASAVQEALGRAAEGLNAVDFVELAMDPQAAADVFSATFGAILGEQGLGAALDALGPSIENLMALFEEMGVDAGEALGPIASLLPLAGEEFEGILASVQGLTDVLGGLTDAGFLTAESFAGVQQGAQAAFDALVAEGAAPEAALLAILPLLAEAKRASETYGIELDANTQSLIEQAEAAGAAFPTDPILQVVDLLAELVRVMGGELPASIGRSTEAFRTFGRTANSATQGVGLPGGFTPGPGSGIPQFATGGVFERATLGVVGERGPEVVAPVAALFGNVVGGVVGNLAPRLAESEANMNTRLAGLEQQLQQAMESQAEQSRELALAIANRPVVAKLSRSDLRGAVQQDLNVRELVVPDAARTQRAQ